MTDIIARAAEPRDRAGKGAARATRRLGRVPAVIYGDKKEPVLVSLEPRALLKEVRKPGFFAKLLDITVNGTTHRTLPRDVQLHPVSDLPIHADFMRVGPNTRITVDVPVHFINQDKAPGLKRGGLLNVVRHEIELLCSADNIPERLVIDLDGLDIGDSVHISAVKLPEGTRPTIGDRDFTVASIAAPTVVREESQAAAAASATAGEAAAPEAAAAAPAKAAPAGKASAASS
jgi:large subunit ribosomal protein L25